MAEYPIILIPDTVQQARLAQPPIPSPPNLPIPQYPGDAPKRINKTLIGVETAAVIVPGMAIAKTDGVGLAGILFFLAGFGAIAAQTWRQLTTFRKRKKKHQHKIAVYRQNKKEYERQKRLYSEQTQVAKSPQKIAKFRYKLLLNILSQTIPHDGNGSCAKRGSSEANFSTHLKQYFDSKIHAGLTLNIPNFEHSYTPDFTYIDPELNLYIDIEIDEPYAYKSKKPIHYLNYRKDENRNNFLLKKGWIIIRFSEEQIVRYPERCCKTVAETIANLLGDRSILNQFENVPQLDKMKQWTYSEAEKMATTDYRKTYRSN